ncbi:hypothetical protein PybrP1_002646 [[Pythium] brassicae (nom. inval.)]|nr:hypothetical protein PybrP1_002646 [[Pythium] brassicae (nom. inval.)]
MTMVLSQFLGMVWSTVKAKEDSVYGHDPSHTGLQPIDGFNDEPYTDRVIACVAEGRHYRAAQLSVLLASATTATVVDTTGASVSGYRLVQRDGLAVDTDKLDFFSGVCSQIAATLHAITSSCVAVGYSVSAEDNLQVLNGVNSSTTERIVSSLPVLIMPFWDNSPYARFAIPGTDGAACMFRLLGKYEDLALDAGVFRTVNRTIRDEKTAEWLGRPGGVWKNGWYEDRVGERWYSDVLTTEVVNSSLGIPMRQFDTVSGKERDCVHTAECRDIPVVDRWGSKLRSATQPTSITSVAISNGNRFGQFFYHRIGIRSVTSTYDWETLVSNITIAALLVRWFVAMYALQNGYFRNPGTQWHNAGLGCIANSKSFNLLPIVLLPKLKASLTAFWTVGCDVEGEQRALADAWFVVYPSIAEVVLIFFSLLNIVAKVQRRRVSDVPFGPTLIFLCLMHRFRVEIAQSRWFGIDGRVPALVHPSEIEQLSLLDYFTTNVSYRINGGVTALFVVKLAVLGCNMLPLMWPRCSRRRLKPTALPPLGIESALAVVCSNLGGLGTSSVYDYNHTQPQHRTGLNPYELVRLGYVVYGNKFLISIDDWEIVTSLWLLQRLYHLWNHRVALFTLHDEGEGRVVSSSSVMCRLDDPRLEPIKWWRLSATPIA